MCFLQISFLYATWFLFLCSSFVCLPSNLRWKIVYIKILAAESHSLSNLRRLSYLMISSTDSDQRSAKHSQMGPTETPTSRSGGWIGDWETILTDFPKDETWVGNRHTHSCKCSSNSPFHTVLPVSMDSAASLSETPWLAALCLPGSAVSFSFLILSKVISMAKQKEWCMQCPYGLFQVMNCVWWCK